MNFSRRSRRFGKDGDESIVVFDSDEDESLAEFHKTKFTETKVIKDSDSESRGSDNLAFDKDYESETKDSDEDEDLQFMNTSHRVSIIENSSEAESDEDNLKQQVQNNKLKRRSIYENPVSPITPGSSFESPLIKSHVRKKSRRIIEFSDSDSENVPVKQIEKLEKSYQKIHINDDENDDMANISNTNEESNHDEKMDYSFGNKSVENQNSNKVVEEKKDISNKNNFVSLLEDSSDSSANNNYQVKVKNLVKKSPKNNQSLNFSNLKKRESRQQSFTDLLDESSDSSSNNRKPLGIKNNTLKSASTPLKEITKNSNIIDLTINEYHSPIRNSNKSVDNIKPMSDEEIIISSTSTSESEMDKDAIEFAKKQIGVGNIDPIVAQKKEYILLNIEATQKQLDKLNKFLKTADINKLPDKGAKVYETIKEHEIKIASLKKKLDKLSQKNTPSIKQKVSTPKIKSEVEPNISYKKSLISPYSSEDEKFNDKKNFQNNIKKEISDIKKEKFSDRFNEFSIDDIPKVPEANFHTNDLGKKALETLNKQQTLTSKRLEQLHGSLTTRPSEDELAKDPVGLKIQLMPHQQHALAWMRWRENQKPRGGILADDMGLGKTLTMISLILSTVDNEKKKETESESDSEKSSDDEWYSRNKRKRHYGGTLVVCPASLIKQWEAEVKNRCKRGLLSVLVYHGNNRKIDDRKLSKYNIVVTTYQIIVREAAEETGFYMMEWNRIILDEAHYIRNHKSKACISACGLSGKYRWALTGTPIQNKEMDLYAVLKFLKCSPFDDLQVWKRWVDNKNDAGKQRLITIMKTIMLRRTKQELQSKGALQSLPDKNIEIIEIETDREEHLVYQKILLFSQNLFAQFLAQRAEKHHNYELHAGKYDKPLSQGSSTQFTKAQQQLLRYHSHKHNTQIESHQILVLLLRLRQMCCHPALINAMLDTQDAELNGIDAEDLNDDILNKLHNVSIREDEDDIEEHVANYKIDERVAANLLTKKNPVFDDDRCSSKVRAVIKTIQEILEKGDKLIVVSQWTSFLKIVAKHLVDVEDASYAMFTGEIPVKERQAIIEKFNDPHEDLNILFLSLTAGGVGLNLVGANHLLLIDIHWNPQLEAQAQDRIYRFGQHKSVYVYKFLCKDTIEERIKVLQDKKLRIAEHVLTGTKSVSSKLTVEDLKLLFS